MLPVAFFTLFSEKLAEEGMSNIRIPDLTAN
jgi:hypothetical protein